MSEQKSKGPPPPPLPPPYPHQKLFKKCKSATFQLDGATYTIGKYRREYANLLFSKFDIKL